MDGKSFSGFRARQLMACLDGLVKSREKGQTYAQLLKMVCV